MARIVALSRKTDNLGSPLPCGVMVTQRPLEALFLVRVQAGQPRKRPSFSRGCANYLLDVGLDSGNANVADGEAAEVALADGDVAGGLGDGVGVGVGGGGIIFSQ